MGDGRYYTYYQFFSVSILVLLSIFTIGSMIIGYYRNQRKKSSEQLFGLLIIIVILKTIELVIPSIILAFYIRCIISFGLLVLYLRCLMHLNNSVFKVLKADVNKSFYCLISMMILLSIITNGNCLIKSYNFFIIEFHVMFAVAILLVSMMTAIYTGIILLRKKQIHSVYKNYGLALIITLFLLVPAVLYFIMMIKNQDYLDFYEIFIYITLSILLNIMVYSKSESGLTVRAFDKIGDIIDDYVFVTDTEGNLIYKNANVIKTNFFVDSEKLEINNIKGIYKLDTEIKENASGNEYIRVMYNGDYYFFTHKKGLLKDNGMIIGHIITIIDITGIMKLLYSLEDRKKKSKEANEKLKNYSKVVYHMEKEKEINSLLEDILLSREKEMQTLINMIEKLKSKDDFQNEVDHVIDFNQKILEDVRKAVSAYRQHYGG